MLRFGDYTRASRTRRSTAARRLRGRLEPLEDRRLPATLFVNADNVSADPNGTQANPYPQIQLALDHAQSGDTIDVAAGTYAESLVITQPVTLLGPNAGVDPNTGTRGPEAVVVPPSDSSNTGIAILVEASGVTIDGLTLDGHNGAIAGGTLLNGVASEAHSGISNVDSNGVAQPIGDLTVQNDIIRNFTQFGVIGDAENDNGANFVSTGNVIENNAIDNMPTVASSPIGNSTQGRGISIEDSFYADVSGNVVTRAATGIQAIYDLNAPSAASEASNIANNDVHAYDRGILVYTADNGGQAVTLTGNSVSPDPTTGPTATAVGIDVERVLAGTNVSLSDNQVSGFPVGVQLGYSPAAGGITVTGGTLSGNGVGLMLTNASPPTPTTTLRPVSAVLNGVGIQDSSTTGIEVVDALGQTGTTVTLTTGPGTTVTGSAEGAALSGAGARLVTTAAPTIAFTQAPPAQTTSTSATFAFSGSDSVSSAANLQYSYQLDNSGTWVNAISPLVLDNLSTGDHTLTVQVVDQGKLTGSATASWQVQAPTAAPAITVSTMTLPAFIFDIPKVPVVFHGVVSDAGSVISSLSYSVTNASGQVVASGAVRVNGDGSYRIIALVDAPRPGASATERTDTVTLTAVDQGGNMATESSTFVLAPTSDWGHHDGWDGGWNWGWGGCGNESDALRSWRDH